MVSNANLSNSFRTTITFYITTKYLYPLNMNKLPLDRMLQSQGFGTRKWCRELIAEGKVHINGQEVTDPLIGIETHNLEFNVYGEQYRYRKHLYIALNKPSNFECSRKPSHHPGVLSLLPEQFIRRDIQPVGRLDHDTTGLLIMTDDGAFIHTLSSPKRNVQKVYIASVHDPVTPQLITLLLSGVKLHDEPVVLAALSCKAVDTHQLEIVLAQGKYHQVKRMLAAAGNHCIGLKRSQIGGLTLKALDLTEGQWCYLDEAQLALLHPHTPRPC